MKRTRKAISMLLMVAMLLADHSISAIATNTEVSSENMRNTKILEHENMQETLLSDNAVSMYEYTGEQLSNSIMVS